MVVLMVVLMVKMKVVSMVKMKVVPTVVLTERTKAARLVVLMDKMLVE